jgi:hypothetical protein
MPRYLVERTLPDGLPAPVGAEDAAACLTIVDRNADNGVTWIHSYVANEGRTMYCVYDGPTPEAIRRSAIANALPVDRITQVRVLHPFSYV